MARGRRDPGRTGGAVLAAGRGEAGAAGRETAADLVGGIRAATACRTEPDCARHRESRVLHRTAPRRRVHARARGSGLVGASRSRPSRVRHRARHGVFEAIVDSSIRQMRAYGELVASATSAVDDFARDNVTDDAGRSWLCAEYPDELALTFVGGKAGRLTVIAKSPAEALGRISADLCLRPPLASLDRKHERQLAGRGRVARASAAAAARHDGADGHQPHPRHRRTNRWFVSVARRWPYADGTLREHQRGHARPRAVTRLGRFLRLQGSFGLGDPACPRFPACCSMVRRGSTRARATWHSRTHRDARGLQARTTDPNQPSLRLTESRFTKPNCAVGVRARSRPFAQRRRIRPRGVPGRPSVCCHTARIVAYLGTKIRRYAGLLVGGTGLEPVTPSLSIRGARSHRRCRSLKPHGERNPSPDRTLERTRANVDCCHSCHARSTSEGMPLASLLDMGAPREAQHVHLPSRMQAPTRPPPQRGVRMSGCCAVWGAARECRRKRSASRRRDETASRAQLAVLFLTP